MGEELALDIVRAFVAARFSGEERHRRRLEKIAAIEKKDRAALEWHMTLVCGGCEDTKIKVYVTQPRLLLLFLHYKSQRRWHDSKFYRRNASHISVCFNCHCIFSRERFNTHCVSPA